MMAVVHLIAVFHPSERVPILLTGWLRGDGPTASALASVSRVFAGADEALLLTETLEGALAVTRPGGIPLLPESYHRLTRGSQELFWQWVHRLIGSR